MEKINFLLIILLFLVFGYLTFLLNFQAMKISPDEKLNLPENTFVEVSGIPSNIKVYSEEIRLDINQINFRVSSIKQIKNKSMTLTGRVSKYNNQTYIKVERVQYDN